jgi:hypothetical protein
MNTVQWLPDLILLSSYSGNWEKYCEGLYTFFCQDFKNQKVEFRGEEIFLRIFPFEKGKEASFWHCVSEGEVEEDRTIDIERCKRIRWPKSMITNDGNEDLKIWQNTRKGYLNYLLLVEKERYLVVIRLKKGKWQLWTTYLATYKHTLEKWLDEYKDYIKNNVAG